MPMRSLVATVETLREEGTGWTLLTVAVGWLLFNGFRVVLPALLPQVKAEFTVGNAGAGFALTVLWGTYALVQFPGGIVADRTGERALLLWAMAFGTVSLVAFYVAPVFVLFLLACAGFGLGAGLFGTPRDMLLTKTFPARVNTAYGITFAAGSIGAAGLPVLATAIAARSGWRTALATLVPVFLLVGVGLWRFVPRGRPGVAAADHTSARATARRTMRAVTNRTVLLAGGAFVLFVFTYQALVAFVPTYLLEVKGMDQSLVATLFGLLFLVGAVTNPLAGHLADRYGERATMLGLVVLATATLVALPLATARGTLAVVVPLLGVRVAVGPVTSAYIVGELPESVQGTGWGLLRTVFFGLGATGSTVVGVFGDAGHFDLAFLLLAALTAATGVFWLFIPGRSGAVVSVRG